MKVQAKTESDRPSKMPLRRHVVDGTCSTVLSSVANHAVFGVNQVIPGWVEALQLMSEGAKWKLYIPSDLGYGARGAGEMIPPHSTLVFEVELLEVL